MRQVQAEADELSFLTQQHMPTLCPAFGGALLSCARVPTRPCDGPTGLGVHTPHAMPLPCCITHLPS